MPNPQERAREGTLVGAVRAERGTRGRDERHGDPQHRDDEHDPPEHGVDGPDDEDERVGEERDRELEEEGNGGDDRAHVPRMQPEVAQLPHARELARAPRQVEAEFAEPLLDPETLARRDDAANESAEEEGVENDGGECGLECGERPNFAGVGSK